MQSPNGVKFGGFDVYDEKSLTSLTITSRPTNCGKQQKRHQIWHPDRLFGIGQNYALFGIHTEKNCRVKREFCTLSRLKPIVLKSRYILLKSHQKRHPDRFFSNEQNYLMFESFHREKQRGIVNFTQLLLDQQIAANNKKGIRSGILIGSLALGKITHCLGCIQSGPYLLGHSSSLKALRRVPKDMGYPVHREKLLGEKGIVPSF